MWIEDIETKVVGNDDIIEALQTSGSTSIKKDLGDRSILVKIVDNEGPIPDVTRIFKLVGVPNFDEVEDGDYDGGVYLTEESLDPGDRETGLRNDPEDFVYLEVGPIRLTMTRGTVSRFVRGMAKVTHKWHE